MQITMLYFVHNIILFCKTIATLVVTYCSYQQETLHKGPVEVRVEFETGDNIPDKTSDYCLILHDRLFSYNPLTSTIRQS